MTTRQHYRELGRVRYIWHASYADPELIYKKHSFCYWDIEDMLFEMFMDDLKEKESDKTIVHADINESFNKWLKANRDRCYGALDDLISFA